MKNFIILFLLTFILIPFSNAVSSDTKQNLNLSERMLNKANIEYKKGNTKIALQYYLQASKYGSADAHFYLYYRYNLDENQTIYHLEKAFELGHQKAGNALFEKLFLRSTVLYLGDPFKAFILHHRQKALGQVGVTTKYTKHIEACIKAGFLDVKGFLKRYNELENYEANKKNIYAGWLLAERASKGGITGKKNNRLALQLVCRSAEVPAELLSAIDFLSKDINKNKDFNICDHVTSGMGSGFCSSRNKRITDRNFDLKYKSLLSEISTKNAELLRQTVSSGLAYINEKAETEERHGGSGISTWINLSIKEQKESFIDLLYDIVKLKPIGVKTNYSEVKTALTFTLQEILSYLSKKPIVGEGRLNHADVMIVQELWDDYSNKASKFMSVIDNSLTQNEWKAFLASKRLNHLENLLGSITN